MRIGQLRKWKVLIVLFELLLENRLAKDSVEIHRISNLQFEVDRSVTDGSVDSQIVFNLPLVKEYFNLQLCENLTHQIHLGCRLVEEGGSLSLLDSFRFQNEINSNLLQKQINELEDLFFYLDRSNQLHTFRVKYDKAIVKYEGHKFIDFPIEYKQAIQKQKFDLVLWKNRIIYLIEGTAFIEQSEIANPIQNLHQSIGNMIVKDDLLFIAGGHEGMTIYEEDMENTNSSFIFVKELLNLKWKEKNTRYAATSGNYFFFLSGDRILVYTIGGGQTIDFVCRLEEQQHSDPIEIISLQAFNTTLVALTKNLDPFTKDEYTYNGYIEFDFLASNQFGCLHKVKSGIFDFNELYLDNTFIYMKETSNIRIQKRKVKSQFLEVMKSNNFSVGLLPFPQKIFKHQTNSFLISVSNSTFQLYSFISISLGIVCPSTTLKESFLGYNATDSFSLMVSYATPSCLSFFSEFKGESTSEFIPQNEFTKALEDDILNSCIIQQQIVVKLKQGYEMDSSDRFLVGILFAIFILIILVFIKCLIIKLKQRQRIVENSTEGHVSRFSGENSQDFRMKNGKFKPFKRSSSNNLANNSQTSVNSSSSVNINGKSIRNDQSSVGMFEEDSLKNFQVYINQPLSPQQSSSTMLKAHIDKTPKTQTEKRTSSEKEVALSKQTAYQQKQLAEVYEAEQAQARQTQYLQYMLRSEQFASLPKLEQERILQHQYELYLEHQRKVKLAQVAKRGGRTNNKRTSKQQNEQFIQKFGAFVEPILETDSDKKMSTRRDHSTFSQYPNKRTSHPHMMKQFPCNSHEFSQQLGENIQTPSHNVFSPSGYNHFQWNDTLKDPNNDESDSLSNQQVLSPQNSSIPFFTIQSISKSLKVPKQVSSYAPYEDEEEEEKYNEDYQVGQNDQQNLANIQLKYNENEGANEVSYKGENSIRVQKNHISLCRSTLIQDDLEGEIKISKSEPIEKQLHKLTKSESENSQSNNILEFIKINNQLNEENDHSFNLSKIKDENQGISSQKKELPTFEFNSNDAHENEIEIDDEDETSFDSQIEKDDISLNC